MLSGNRQADAADIRIQNRTTYSPGEKEVMKELEELIGRMAPERALTVLAEIVKNIFPHVDDNSRMNFVYALTGGAGEGSAADLVHL